MVVGCRLLPGYRFVLLLPRDCPPAPRSRDAGPSPGPASARPGWARTVSTAGPARSGIHDTWSCHRRDLLADYEDEQQVPRRNPNDRTVVFDGDEDDEVVDPVDAPYSRGDENDAVG